MCKPNKDSSSGKNRTINQIYTVQQDAASNNNNNNNNNNKNNNNGALTWVKVVRETS
jgi:hypothetical protein